MAPPADMQTAMVNRSIRTIKAELEYLCDASVISPQTLSSLLSQIPPQTALHAPLSVGAVPAERLPEVQQPPSNALNNMSLADSRQNSNYNEKQNSYMSQPTTPQPPPAYNSPPPQANWPALAKATAIYAYTSTDDGDLELQPNDQIDVTEYMNAEWWKGKNVRTGRQGIFPRSYVRVNEEKGAQPVVPQSSNYNNNYGNAPLQVSQMGNGTGEAPNKGSEMGKKFGKKLGNAAIFGAGATLGGNLVNSIF